MTKTNHSVQGLTLKEVYIDDGKICVAADRGTLVVGDYANLINLPPYRGGTYETQNGLEIDLKEYINELGITPRECQSLKTSTPTKSEGEEISERMVAFNAILHPKLEADIK